MPFSTKFESWNHFISFHPMSRVRFSDMRHIHCCKNDLPIRRLVSGPALACFHVNSGKNHPHGCSADSCCLVPLPFEPVTPGLRRRFNLSSFVPGCAGSESAREKRYNSMGRGVGIDLLERPCLRSVGINFRVQAQTTSSDGQGFDAHSRRLCLRLSRGAVRLVSISPASPD
jgi:hypothetical protein